MADEWETCERSGWTVRNRRRGAATWGAILIKVGLVAGLAALLWAVLFAVYSRGGRERHHAPAACVSNLKQIGLGLIQYAQDYDSALPPAPWHARDAQWPAIIDVYLKSTMVFECPTVKAGISYGLNDRLYRTPMVGDPRSAPRLSDMPSTGETYLLLESSELLAHPLLAPPVARHPDRRPTMTNVCFLDSHVKQYRADALKTGGEPWPNGWDPTPAKPEAKP